MTVDILDFLTLFFMVLVPFLENVRMRKIIFDGALPATPGILHHGGHIKRFDQWLKNPVRYRRGIIKNNLPHMFKKRAHCQS